MINVDKLAKVSVGNHSNLPCSSGVYFAVDAAKRVWYIGKATNLRERLSTHNRYDDFLDNEVQFIAYQECESPEKLESELIDFFNPPLNQNCNKLPEVNIDGLTLEQCFEKFCHLSEIKKSIEAELNMLKPNVVTYVQEYGEDSKKLRTEGYNVYIKERPKWIYSDELTAMEAKLKKLQAKEKKDGIATIESMTIYPEARIVSSSL